MNIERIKKAVAKYICMEIEQDEVNTICEEEGCIYNGFQIFEDNIVVNLKKIEALNGIDLQVKVS